MEFLADVQIGQVLALLGAALAALLGGMGSAKGVGIAAEAGAGVIAEDPDRFGQVLVLEALPGTQGVYGFLIGFIVMLKTNVIGGMYPVSNEQGLMLLMGCLPVAIVGYYSAVAQGKAAAASIGLVGRRGDQGGKGITMTVLVETYAVLALLSSFLMVWFTNIPVA